VDLYEAEPAQTDPVDSGAPCTELTMEEVADSIWRLTEDVLELLRAQATRQVRRQKRPEALWIDDVTRAQANTVIAVRQLSETYPEGVTLRKLAETIGVTPAAASVMVDLLVKKKMLKRTRSKSDRRSVLIRLNPETAGLFEITEESLRQSVMYLAESLGTEVLHDWHKTLSAASGLLRQMMGTSARVVPELPEQLIVVEEEPSPEAEARGTEEAQSAGVVSS